MAPADPNSGFFLRTMLPSLISIMTHHVVTATKVYQKNIELFLLCRLAVANVVHVSDAICALFLTVLASVPQFSACTAHRPLNYKERRKTIL